MKRASVGRCFKSRKSRFFLQKASCRHPGYDRPETIFLFFHYFLWNRNFFSLSKRKKISFAYFAFFGSCAAACFDFDSSPASGAYFCLAAKVTKRLAARPILAT
ncbi:hypothetical protein, partial [Flavobacterium sp.]|uniref:hypothetical protein n=1 Tax=Flavobacterium sp. TaxID=239 RepID=UPI0025C1B7CA